MGLLGEFLVVLNLCFAQLEEDSDAIMEILKAFPSCPRFALALRFLGKDERTAVRVWWSVCITVVTGIEMQCQQLLQKLRATSDLQDTTSTSKTASLQELTKLYSLCCS